MDEWWTYTLTDLLLFSPRTYYRMLERHNEAVWPAQLLALGAGFGLAGLVLRPTARQGQIISTVLAVGWVWVGWAFLWHRYAAINWTAKYLAPIFLLQALLFIWLGVVRGSLNFHPRRAAGGRLGMALFVSALVLYPVLAPISGRPWEQSELFAIVADPTAIATLGLLLTLEGPRRWALLVLPLLWCGITGMTLWAMKSPEALVPLIAGLLVLAAPRTSGGLLQELRKEEKQR
jgi:hypothetical protein